MEYQLVGVDLKNEIVLFFMEVIILMCWTIWNARNDKIFWQIDQNLQISKQNFRDEFQLCEQKEATIQELINGLQI